MIRAITNACLRLRLRLRLRPCLCPAGGRPGSAGFQRRAARNHGASTRRHHRQVSPGTRSLVRHGHTAPHHGHPIRRRRPRSSSPGKEIAPSEPGAGSTVASAVGRAFGSGSGPVHHHQQQQVHDCWVRERSCADSCTARLRLTRRALLAVPVAPCLPGPREPVRTWDCFCCACACAGAGSRFSVSHSSVLALALLYVPVLQRHRMTKEQNVPSLRHYS